MGSKKTGSPTSTNSAPWAMALAAVVEDVSHPSKSVRPDATESAHSVSVEKVVTCTPSGGSAGSGASPARLSVPSSQDWYVVASPTHTVMPARPARWEMADTVV